MKNETTLDALEIIIGWPEKNEEGQSKTEDDPVSDEAFRANVAQEILHLRKELAELRKEHQDKLSKLAATVAVMEAEKEFGGTK